MGLGDINRARNKYLDAVRFDRVNVLREQFKLNKQQTSKLCGVSNTQFLNYEKKGYITQHAFNLLQCCLIERLLNEALAAGRCDASLVDAVLDVMEAEA